MAIGDVVLRGEDRTYTLNFGVNAMCRIEKLEGRSYHAVLTDLRDPRPSMTLVRTVLRAALTNPATPTDDEAGDILDDLGGPQVVVLSFVRSYEAIDDVGRQITEAQQHDSFA